MNLKPRWLATGIGSLPITDIEEGISLIFDYMPEIPFWPQFPKRSHFEDMTWQFTEAMPRLREDSNSKKVWVDVAGDITGDLEVFYEHYLSGDIGYFAISEEHAPGFYAFVDRLKKGAPEGLRAVKGHITGPVTVGMGLRDAGGGYTIYNPDIFDAVLKTLAMKALWQIEELKKFNAPVIIFMDEPAMVSFGSAYFSVGREQIIGYWNEIIDVIKGKEGIVGVHCCGNMDWSVPFESRLDIVNFDAHGYAEKLAIYPKELKGFLERGGVLAWGIVPTERGGSLDLALLLNRLENAINALIALGIDKRLLFDQSMITPSCGLGSLTKEEAVEILKTTKEVSRIMQDRY